MILEKVMSEKTINKDMTFGDVLRNFPKAGPILAGHGLHCIGCHISTVESIEQGVYAHGMSEEKLDEIIEDLNENAI
jgi:hybrid cluster-associated redox disulfide protein